MSLAWDVRSTSGAESIPEGWQVRRVGDLVTLTNGHPFPSDTFGPTGEIPLVRIRDLTGGPFETYVTGHVPPAALLRDGDVVIGMDGDFNLTTWNRGPAALNQRVCLLRPRDSVDMRFIAYALPTSLKIINDLTFATTVKHLSSTDVLNERIMLPRLEEQRRIADFLDTETARIGKILQRTETQADLLRLRRRAFIDAHLDGGNEGQQTVPLRYLLHPSFESERPDLQVLSVYRDFGIIPKKSRQDNYNKTPEDVSRYLVVNPGDVVINKMKAWQGSLGVSQHHGIVSPDYLVAKVTSDSYDPSYLHYLLRSPRLVGEYAVRSRGIRPSQWRLYWDDLATISVPVTPRTQQEAKVHELEREDTWVERLLAAIQLRSRLLTERRQALITAAVTGQFDVSTASGRNVTEGAAV